MFFSLYNTNIRLKSVPQPYNNETGQNLTEICKFQFVELFDYPCCRGGSLNHGVIATGNHIHSDSLRGAPPSRRKIRPRWADFSHLFVFRSVFATFVTPYSGRVKTLPYGLVVCKQLAKSQFIYPPDCKKGHPVEGVLFWCR